MKKLLLALGLISASVFAITTQQSFLLDNYMGPVAGSVKLGTLLTAATNASVPAAGSVSLAKLASGILPSHVIKFASQYHTLGGSATEVVTVTGVLATDIVQCTIQKVGATPRTLTTCAPTTNTITIVFSGDPSTDHIVAYEVARAAQ
jgi:hypothetical protein